MWVAAVAAATGVAAESQAAPRPAAAPAGTHDRHDAGRAPLSPRMAVPNPGFAPGREAASKTASPATPDRESGATDPLTGSFLLVTMGEPD